MTQPRADKGREIRERIRGNFDRGAAPYARFEDTSGFFRRLLEKLLEPVPPLKGLRVLDVGCGTGASLGALQEAVGENGWSLGLDISLGMLRQARRRLGAGASLLQMDACSFAEGLRRSFDAVVYNAVLFMLPDARDSLRAATRVLRPGGWILASHLEGAWLRPKGATIGEALAERGLPAGRHAVSPWPAVLSALREEVGAPKVERLELRMSPDEFRAFYGLEPMSAGLLPSLDYPARLTALREAAQSWEARGEGVEQVWNLAAVRWTASEGLPTDAASKEGTER